jgi:hypothetical protein
MSLNGNGFGSKKDNTINTNIIDNQNLKRRSENQFEENDIGNKDKEFNKQIQKQKQKQKSNIKNSNLKLRESMEEKAKIEKYYTCNSNDVIFFKIGK